MATRAVAVTPELSGARDLRSLGEHAAPQPERPPEAEIEVSVPAPRQAPPRSSRIRVRELLAEEEPSPGPPRVSAVDADAAYRQALEEGTLEALVRFVDAFPDAPQSREATRRADQLREKAAYQRALARNDPEGYRDYLRRFPDSERRPEVEARLRVTERMGERRKKRREGQTR